ncbi:alpha-L-fucosidase [Saccharothrix deserti]|uniref:alpha-L-fucosidase n=1 Tax=Saccharothrix deserti TaxID=2593674 RepID=UPI00131CFC00|nr:alpha-L-fucosidase [Saccharothrix deserti]
MTEDRVGWFTEARFGLFVHWGLYSLAARHEWVKQREKLSDADYQRYFDHFRADRFDARKWARDAKAAGMRYAVLTTKHHDGFCLWDSALTDYKSTNTPAGRDVVAEFVEAFRAEGLRIGLYHSLLDWHHPDFTIDGWHPQWDDRADLGELNAGRDMDRYLAYLHCQVRELVTAYQPDLLWFDFSYDDDHRVTVGKGAADWRADKLVGLVRELSPHTLINDRLGLSGSEDFATAEEASPDTAMGAVPWEACRTLNGSWGYAPGFQQWLDAGQVVRILVDSVSKGGNLLLNVGPDGRGAFEPQARELLAEVGAWTELHGDAIHGAGAAPEFTAPRDTRLTRSGNRLFVHVFGWQAGTLVLAGLAERVRYASFLHDGAEVECSVVDEEGNLPHLQNAGPPGSLVVHLPTRRPDVLLPVIELILT